MMVQVIAVVAIVMIVMLDAVGVLAGYRMMKKVCLKIVESIENEDDSREP